MGMTCYAASVGVGSASSVWTMLPTQSGIGLLPRRHKLKLK